MKTKSHSTEIVLSFYFHVNCKCPSYPLSGGVGYNIVKFTCKKCTVNCILYKKILVGTVLLSSTTIPWEIAGRLRAGTPFK